MPIKATQNKDKNLTIHVATGQVTEEDVITTVKSFYAGKTTELILWDLSQADMVTITPAVIQQIIKITAKTSANRRRGKTAAAAPSDLKFGLGRMAESYAELEALPFNYRVFRSRQEALQWLMPNNDT